MLKNQIVMTNYLSLQELVSKIEKNISQLEAGQLHNQDLEVQLELVRELYERTLILRYKAFEGATNVTVAPINTVVEVEQEIVETPIIEEKAKEVEPIEIPSIKAEEPVAVATEIEFDFFSTNTEETIETTQEEEVKEEIVLNEEPEIVAPTENHFDSIDEKIAPEETFFNEPEPETTIVETTIETPVAPINEFQSTATPVESATPSTKVEQKIAQIKLKMNSQLGYYTISSLIGSFGLNERLLYINELFDGSSEAFSDAIKQLDAKTSLSDATIFTSELVHKFNWDIESDTVEEFFQKLCRRYA